MQSLVKCLLPPRTSGVFGNVEGCAAIQDDEECEEQGHWHYLVVQQVAVASKAERPKSGERLSISAGEIFSVDRRRCLRQCKGTCWSRMLRLKSSGKWVVDVSLSNGAVNLVEVLREMGPWKYQACSTVTVLKKPAVCDNVDGSSNILATICAGHIIKVAERYSVVGHTDSFLRLTNQGGDGGTGRWARDDKGDMNPALVRKGQVLPPKPVVGTEGTWDYIVAAPDGLKTATGRHLKEGELVQIVSRQPCKQSEKLFLSDGSVIADTHFHGGSLYRALVPVSSESGHWVYSVVAKSGATVRNFATTKSSAWLRGRRLKLGEQVSISRRVRCGLTVFLELSDGRGWLFIAKNGKQIMARECDTFSCKGEDQQLEDAITDVGSESSGTDGGNSRSNSLASQTISPPLLPSSPMPRITINGDSWSPSPSRSCSVSEAWGEHAAHSPMQRATVV